MDDFAKIILEVCTSVILVEVMIQLFPNKFKSIVHGTVLLAISLLLLSGMFQLDIDIDSSQWNIEADITDQNLQQNTIEYGVAILKERIYTILDAAGIAVLGKEDGITVHYRMPEEDRIEICGVQVNLRYKTDHDRAYALLQGILTPLIPVEVYTE